MDLPDVERSLEGDAPPAGVPDLVRALWHERKGDWARAHEIAQDIDGADAAWVHAYLHRREGDPSNAGYWYRQAGRAVNHGDMDAEWREIIAVLLNR